MEDSKLLLLLWNRAEGAIAALEKRYGGLLYRIAMNILQVHHDAEECVNDTYLALWNAIPPQRPDPLSGYACKTCRNIALNHLRKSSAQKRQGDYDLSLDELAGCIPGKCLEETVSARALGRAIDRFLEKQSKENRIIFLRRYWFGDSVQQIAKLLGLTPNATSVRLNRTRDKLKEYLKQEALYEAQ